MSRVDVAIITVISEEYSAVIDALRRVGCRVDAVKPTAKKPNLYGWVTATLPNVDGELYHLVVGATISPGPAQMANAVNATVTRFKPRYVLLVGIAGGFHLDELAKGDVVISKVIYDFEYGKLTTTFQPRHDNTYQVDEGLYRSAITLNARDQSWTSINATIRPSAGEPKLLAGVVASGGKVVDDTTNTFFAEVLASWPKLLAVEMEGAGAVSAINSCSAGGHQVGFLMVRGISDMPAVASAGSPHNPTEGNKAERDTWKKYAAAVAASFTIHWITKGWPLPPVRRVTRAAVQKKDDDDPPPTSSRPDAQAVRFDPFTHTPDPSVWLGFVKAALGERDRKPSFEPSVVKAVLAALAEHGSSTAPVDAGAEAELALSKAAIERHEPEVAEAKLKEIETRYGDRLRPSQWYELKALRSRILSNRWEWSEAGRLLLDAKRHMPDVERAKVNEALGLELCGQREAAHALATKLRAEYPFSVRLLTIWVRTAPAAEPFERIVEITAAFAGEDEELNLALAHRACQYGRFEDALPFAARATQLDPTSSHAWFVLGEAKHAAAYNRLPTGNLAMMREAAGHYEYALELAQRARLPGLEAAIRLNRAKIHHLLGHAGADADFRRAVELAAPEQMVWLEYASYLVEVGRYPDAVVLLEKHAERATADSRFYEAAARRERGEGDDRMRAADLLMSVIEDTTADRWADAHILFVQWAVEDDSLDRAEQLIAGANDLRVKNPLVFFALSGWLKERRGDEGASDDLLSALNALTPDTKREHLSLLAQALTSVEEDELALPLLERSYRPGVFDVECRKLLDCARRLERHDILRRVCQELREAGVTDPKVVETEIGAVQLYDPENALRIAMGHLAKHPNDRHVALWQSTIALRLGRHDLVISDPGKLPTPSAVTAQGSALVINLLSSSGQQAAALRFAYDTLRIHFDEEFAHGQYIARFLQLSDHCPELRVGGTVGPGMAVCYREGSDGADQWLVIEDGPDADMGRGEYTPAHPLSQALNGHRVGETITLSDRGVQPRAFSIREVLHKYIYRFRTCLSQYQVLFPGGSAIQMVTMGKEGEFDPSPLIKSLEENRQHIESIDRLFRENPVPFATYVELSGRDEFAVWGHLVSTEGLGIRCSGDTPWELREAAEVARDSSTLVLDLTALITMAELELLSVLKGQGRRHVVSRSTFERLESLVEDDVRVGQPSGTAVLDEAGRLGFMEVTAEDIQRRRQFMTSLRDAVREGCEVRSCPETGQLDPKKRADMIKVIGRHNLDTLLLAASPATGLWADDAVLGLVARTDFACRRTWSLPVLVGEQQHGRMTESQIHQVTARLAGWRYHSLRISEDTLVAAAELAGWAMDRAPVPTVFATLGNDSANAVERVRVAVHALRLVWRRDVLGHSRMAFLFAVLGGLRSRRLVQRLYQVVPSVFSVDVLGADEVRDGILTWLQHPTTGVIFP